MKKINKDKEFEVSAMDTTDGLSGVQELIEYLERMIVNSLGRRKKSVLSVYNEVVDESKKS